jgi:hypothetical protein
MLLSLLKSKAFQPRYLEKSTPAWIGHLPFAYWLVLQQKPHLVVELGTHYGNSYFTFCQAVAADGLPTRCFAVDSWEGDEQAGSYGDAVYEKVTAHNAARYQGFSELLRMRFEDAAGRFKESSIDLLHIDGLHTYDAVRHDHETWMSKLAPDALVLFHDVAVEKEGFGTKRYWQELKGTYPHHMEFSHNFGLGVMAASSGPGARAASWLRRGSFRAAIVHRIFSHRGIALAVKHKQSKT